MSKATKAAVDSVVQAMMERPGDFDVGEVTMEDAKTDYKYWICNGVFSAGLYKPYKLWFGLIHGWRFLKAVKGLKIHKLVKENKEVLAEA